MRSLLCFASLVAACTAVDDAAVSKVDGPLMCVDDRDGTPPGRVERLPLEDLFVDGGSIETQQKQEAYLRQDFRNSVLESLWRAEKEGHLEGHKNMWIRAGHADLVEEFERDRPMPKSLLNDTSFWQSPEERERERERKALELKQQIFDGFRNDKERGTYHEVRAALIASGSGDFVREFEAEEAAREQAEKERETAPAK
ncbi:MAG: hypothetical protein AAFX94_15595 [Myxococcota bacterium]